MDWLVWGFLLLGVALFMVVIEIFVPTAGLLGLGALLVAGLGVMCLFRAGLNWGLGGLLSVMVSGPIIFFYGLKIYRNTAVGRMMTSADADAIAAEARDLELAAARERERLLGMEAVVVTELRPIGVVEIEGRRHDALSETTLVRAGTRVRVTAVEPQQVRVRPVAS
jgi:membrane-bound serine protease (ClpP class)